MMNAPEMIVNYIGSDVQNGKRLQLKKKKVRFGKWKYTNSYAPFCVQIQKLQ